MTSRTIIHTWLAPLLLAAAVATPAHAAIHKWVDEHGVTHFGDRPPASSGATRVDVRTHRPTAQERAAAARRTEALEQRSRERRGRRQKQRAARAVNEQDQARLPSECLAARRDWDILTEGLRVYRDELGTLHLHLGTDTYTGKRHYLDDDEREQVKAAVQASIVHSCEQPDDPQAQARAREIQIRSELCEAATARVVAASQPNARTPRSEMKRFETARQSVCD